MSPLTTTSTTAALFLASTLLFLLVVNKRKKTNPPDARRDDDDQDPSSSSPHYNLSKEEIVRLRSLHFSKNVTISYSNSGDGLLITRGYKNRLYEDDNNHNHNQHRSCYLDTRNNVAHCGHSHPAIVRAVQRQVAILNTNTRYLHSNAVRLAQRLTRCFVPSSSSSDDELLSVVFLVNSGSEANDLALRLARNYTRSKNTIVVEGAYHGHTLATLQVSPYKYESGTEFVLQQRRQLDDCTVMMTPSKHVWKVPAPDVYRGRYRNHPKAGELYAQHVVDACRHYFDSENDDDDDDDDGGGGGGGGGGGRVSAFIMEGGLSVGGVILPPPGYLQKAVSAVREAGGVYIADEVQTGFGRLGKCFWAFEYKEDDNDDDEIVVPDIVTVGKPFGNGMPLAAVVTTRKIADAFASTGVEFFSTFGGNPVCAAAGLAVLDVIEREGLQQNALKVGGYLKDGFMKLQRRLDIIGDVRGSGLFLGVELVRDRDTLEPATEETSFLCTRLKEKYYILTSIDGFHENVIVIKPPMTFSKDDADLFLSCFEKAVCEDLAAVGDSIVGLLAKTPT